MNSIERLSQIKWSVRLQKLNDATYITEVVGLAQFLGLPKRDFGSLPGPEGQVHARIEHYRRGVWLCAIGRGQSHFGLSAEQAAAAAINAYEKK